MRSSGYVAPIRAPCDVTGIAEGMTPEELTRVDEVAAILVSDRPSLLRMSNRWPPLLTMSTAAVMERMLLLRRLLPGAPSP
jgi:hypothetical protein